jgi:hypothetical protein
MINNILIFLFGMLAGYIVCFAETVKSLKSNPEKWQELVDKVNSTRNH